MYYIAARPAIARKAGLAERPRKARGRKSPPLTDECRFDFSRNSTVRRRTPPRYLHRWPVDSFSIVRGFDRREYFRSPGFAPRAHFSDGHEQGHDGSRRLGDHRSAGPEAWRTPGSFFGTGDASRSEEHT